MGYNPFIESNALFLEAKLYSLIAAMDRLDDNFIEGQTLGSQMIRVDYENAVRKVFENVEKSEGGLYPPLTDPEVDYLTDLFLEATKFDDQLMAVTGMFLDSLLGRGRY